jgi:Carboxypeptidase regulatory-like domain
MMNAARALLLLTAAGLGGQPFGSLAGSVVDPLGAVLPNARVTLTQPARQARYEIRTDRLGGFEFAGLPDGEYALEVDTPGFERYRYSLSVAGQPLRRSITMRIGTLHETITIRESDAPAASPQAGSAAYTDPPCPAIATSPTAVGGNLRPPVKLADAKPDYPPSLRGTGREATVVVDGRIGLDGFLKDIQPHDAVDAAFYDALLLALPRWRFSNTLLNCVPQEVDINITAHFAPR